jgi:hypothetical protein
MSSDNKILYEERLKRINDALSLKEPDRVPVAPQYMTFPFKNSKSADKPR